mgnify:CR=1 FL=1
MKHIVQQIHFIGIGGAGMSGIAEVLLNLGYQVSGSDLAAKDVFNDGYTNPSGVEKRVVLTKTLTSGMRPLMLCDEGITYYGTTLRQCFAEELQVKLQLVLQLVHQLPVDLEKLRHG